MQYIHMMEYYSVMKRNEVLIPAMVWMNPDSIALSQTEAPIVDSICMKCAPKGKLIET